MALPTAIQRPSTENKNADIVSDGHIKENSTVDNAQLGINRESPLAKKMKTSSQDIASPGTSREFLTVKKIKIEPDDDTLLETSQSFPPAKKIKVCIDENAQPGTGQTSKEPLKVKKENISEEDNTQAGTSQGPPPAKKMKVADYLKISVTLPDPANRLKKIGGTTFSVNGRLLIPKENVIGAKLIDIGWRSRCSYTWNVMPPHPKLLPTRSKVPYVPGTIGPAREVETELAAFEIYFTEKMLQTILTHTNDEIKISEYYISSKPEYNYPMSMTELKAFIGILFLFAANKDCISPSFLWSAHGSNVYNSIISDERFEYLTKCLRFDDYTTRDIAAKRDSFSLIRDIWNQFITTCSEVFRPSANCTIDEMYVNFKGSCSFQLPVPKEPEKYGIDLILLCDAHNKYVISGFPYTDLSKNCYTQAQSIVEKITKPIRGTNITITYAQDWLFSVPICIHMFRQYKLTSVGILNKTFREIPAEMIETESRPENTTIFAYNIRDELQLCSYGPAFKGEINIFLSNVHFQSIITEPERVPQVLEYFNLTKQGVDNIKNMCRNHSCVRPSAKWVLSIFYTILDLAGINAFTILNINRSRYGQPRLHRVDFLYKLAMDLMLPYMKERLNSPNVDISTKNKIQGIITDRHNIKLGKTQTKPTGQKIQVKQSQKPTQLVPPYTGQKLPMPNKLQYIQTPPTQIRPVTRPVSAQQYLDWSQLHCLNMLNQSYLNTFHPMAPTLQPQLYPTILPIQQTQTMYSFIPHNMYQVIQIGPFVNYTWIPLNSMMQQFQNLYQTSYTAPFIPPPRGPFLNYGYEPQVSTWQEIQALYPSSGLLADPIPKIILPPKVTPTILRQEKNIKVNQLRPIVKHTEPASSGIMKVERNSPKISKKLPQIGSLLLGRPIKKELSNSAHDFSIRKHRVGKCGVCNAISEKFTLAECSRCSILLCKVHRKKLCNNCFFSIKLDLTTAKEITYYNSKGICGLCKPQKYPIKFSAQCYKCLKFVCSGHLQVVCCFCEM